jgi:hypothetical protein
VLNCTTVTVSSLIYKCLILLSLYCFTSDKLFRGKLHYTSLKLNAHNLLPTLHLSWIWTISETKTKTRTEKNSSLVPCSELHQRYSLWTFQLNSTFAFYVPKFCLGRSKLKIISARLKQPHSAEFVRLHSAI